MIGQTISHYKIIEKLGAGGMGVVYRAEDTRLRRFVALKLLPRDLICDPEAKTRLVHEAQAASLLDHPNVCPVYEVDETADGDSFIVMAYCDGKSLRERIESGPLKIHDVIDIAVQIAAGLKKAHEAGVIHRDIKPANILITSDGVARIVDFGLAKLWGRTRLTRTGASVGTIEYMSPEQSRGDVVDHRTDIWSLGCMLYEMLTGLHPFRGDYEQAIVYSILNASPEPVTAVRSGVPVELERIVTKCLQKLPDERYQSVADIIADLTHLQRTTALPSEPAPIKSRRRNIRGSRHHLTGLAVILVLTVAAGMYLFILRRPSEPPVSMKTIAVLPFVNLSGNQDDEYFSDGIMEDILTQLSKIGELTVISRTTMMQYKGVKKSLKDIGRELNAGAVLEGSVRRSGSRLRIASQLIDAGNDRHLWAETYDRDVQDIFAVQSDVAQQIAGALKVTLSPQEKEYIENAPTRNTAAYDYYLKGREYYNRYRNADNESAISLFKKAISLDSNFALPWAGLGDAYTQRVQRFGFPIRWYDSTMAMSKKAVELDPHSAEAYKALGVAYTVHGLFDRAIDAYTRAIDLNPNYVPAIYNLGNRYLELGEFSNALYWHLRADRLSPNNPGSSARIGYLYWKIGDTLKARLRFEKAFDLQFDELGVFADGSDYYLSQGLDQAAVGLMKRVLASNSGNPIALERSGYAAALTGDPTSAEEYYRRALEIRSSGEAIGDSSGDTMLGWILMGRGRKDRAEKIFARQRMLADEKISKGFQGGSPEFTLACVYAIQGNTTGACRFLERAIERGQRDYQLIQRDPRLRSLHGHPQFARAIALAVRKVDEQRNLIAEIFNRKSP